MKGSRFIIYFMTIIQIICMSILIGNTIYAYINFNSKDFKIFIFTLAALFIGDMIYAQMNKNRLPSKKEIKDTIKESKKLAKKIVHNHNQNLKGGKIETK